MPAVSEAVEELLEARRVERDERRCERLHALWLVASGQAANRTELARRLGRNRETVSRWLADYVQGALAAWLRAPPRPGPPSRGGISLPVALQRAVRAHLTSPQGERGYRALWQWGASRTWRHDGLLAPLALGARSAWGCPQGGAQKPRTKKEDQRTAFRDAGLKEKLATVQANHPGQRVGLWCQDQSRFGLQTSQRRRLTLPGAKPICPFEQAFENFWLCGAVQPNTGEAFVLEPRTRVRCRCS